MDVAGVARKYKQLHFTQDTKLLRQANSSVRYLAHDDLNPFFKSIVYTH